MSPVSGRICFSIKDMPRTELVNPDFVMISKAYNIPAKKVVEREDLKDALSEMIEAKGPYLLEIIVQKEGNVLR